MPKVVVEVVVPNPQDGPGIQLRRLSRNLDKYLQGEVSRTLLRDYEDTVVNWRGKPNFTSEYKTQRAKILKVYPTGQNTTKWKRVSDGTGPRVIRAKPGKVMVFPKHYVPKTFKGGPYGGPGKKHGPIQYRKQVYHSTDPRQFSLTIRKKREREIIDGVKNVVRKSVR